MNKTKTPKVIKKSDNHEVEIRVVRVYSLLINGFTGTEIAHDTTLLEEWKINERQIWKYISRARELLHEESLRVREVEIGKAIRRYEKMYRKMDAVGDYRGCLAAQARIDDLLSLHDAKKIDITTKGEAIGAPPEMSAILRSMDNEQIARYIDAGRE